MTQEGSTIICGVHPRFSNKTMSVSCDIPKMTSSIFIQYDTDTIDIVGRRWSDNSFRYYSNNNKVGLGKKSKSNAFKKRVRGGSVNSLSSWLELDWKWP